MWWMQTDMLQQLESCRETKPVAVLSKIKTKRDYLLNCAPLLLNYHCTKQSIAAHLINYAIISSLLLKNLYNNIKQSLSF